MMVKRGAAAAGVLLVLLAAAGLVLQSLQTHQRNCLIRDSLSRWECGIAKMEQQVRSLRQREEGLHADPYSMEQMLRREGSIGEGERVIPAEAVPGVSRAPRGR